MWVEVFIACFKTLPGRKGLNRISAILRILWNQAPYCCDSKALLHC